MEVSEDRGIESQGVCFDLVDGKIVLAVYKNLPGIKRHLAGTSFLRAFTIDDWKAINGYLMDAVGDVEETFDGVIKIDSKGKVHPPEAVKVLSDISQLRGGPVFPGKMIPLKKEEEREEEVVKEWQEITNIHSERMDSSVNKTIYPSTPKVSSIPSMTKNYNGEE